MCKKELNLSSKIFTDMKNYRIVRTYTLDEGEYEFCEHCGRVIRRVAIVEDESGQRMRVGYDCSATMTGDTTNKFESRNRRAATFAALLALMPEVKKSI